MTMLDFDNIDCAWKRAVADPENHPNFHMRMIGAERPLASEVMEELIKEKPTSEDDKVLSDTEKEQLMKNYLNL